MTLSFKYNDVIRELETADFSGFELEVGSEMIGELTIPFNNVRGKYNNFFNRGDSFSLFFSEENTDYYVFTGFVDNIKVSTENKNIMEVRFRGAESKLKDLFFSRRYIHDVDRILVNDIVVKALEETNLSNIFTLLNASGYTHAIGISDNYNFGYDQDYIIDNKNMSELLSSLASDFGLRWWTHYLDDRLVYLFLQPPRTLVDDTTTNIDFEIEDGRIISKTIENVRSQKFNRIYATVGGKPYVEQDWDDIRTTGKVRAVKCDYSFSDDTKPTEILTYLRTEIENNSFDKIIGSLTIHGDYRIVPGMICTVNDVDGMYDPTDRYEIVKVVHHFGSTYIMDLSLERIETNLRTYLGLTSQLDKKSTSSDSALMIPYIDTAKAFVSYQFDSETAFENIVQGFGYIPGYTEADAAFRILNQFKTTDDLTLTKLTAAAIAIPPGQFCQGYTVVKLTKDDTGIAELRWDPPSSLNLHYYDRVYISFAPISSDWFSKQFEIKLIDGWGRTHTSATQTLPGSSIWQEYYIEPDGTLICMEDIVAIRIVFSTFVTTGIDLYVDNIRGRLRGKSSKFVSGSISSSADAGGGQVEFTTSANHGLLQGDFVRIYGTTDYDGLYSVYDVGSATRFSVTVAWNVDRTGSFSTAVLTSYSSSAPDYEMECAKVDLDFFTDTHGGRIIGARAGVPSGTVLTTELQNELTDGGNVRIYGTTSYNGSKTIVQCLSGTEFKIADAFVADEIGHYDIATVGLYGFGTAARAKKIISKMGGTIE